MTLSITLKPDEEKALNEQARRNGRDPAQYAQQIIRDHIEAEKATLDDLIDHEFVAYCEREGDESVTLDEVLEATSRIKESMSRFIIDQERSERF